MKTFLGLGSAARSALAFALFLFAGVAAHAETAYLVSPHYGIEERDTSVKTLPAATPIVHTASGITFNLYYRDIINANGLGFNGPDGTAARARINNALTYIASILNTTGTLDILVELSDPALYPGLVASAGTFYPGTPGIHTGATLFRIAGGTKQFANNEEINLKVLFNRNWNFTNNPPAADEFDFLSVMIHEFTHGLGLVSLAGSNGVSLISPNVYSIYDNWLRLQSDLTSPLFDITSGYLGIAGDLRGEGLVYTGPNAFISYNRAIAPPIHSPATFLQGTSLSHWSATRLLGASSVMKPTIIVGQATRVYREFELAALRDLGYANISYLIESTGEGEGEGEGVGEGEGEGEGAPDCTLDCVSSTPDSDGDGLSDLCEQCIGSSPTNPDTDGDLLPDGFEYDSGLDPVETDDADGDVDYDGASNFEEYLYLTDPLDIDDPSTVRFVDPVNGIDNPSHGILGQPWATVNYALTQINGPATIKLSEGTYNESITLEDNITLLGPECSDGSALQFCAVITGSVTGANGSVLKNLALQNTGGGVLLNMSNVGMHVKNVQFLGDAGRSAIGIRVIGAATVDSVIEGCIFDSLDIGIEIQGAIPKIRKNIFRNHNTAYIVIRATALIKVLGKEGSLGDTTDTETGFNSFEPPVADIAVINETDQTVSMENNYWGTSNSGTADNRIDGPADFQPFLASANAILASSIYCTVTETGTAKRVLNATVDLAPGGVKSVFDNTNGVYVFAALPNGSYTVTANAPGFDSASQSVSVAAGATATPILVISASVGEGEEEGEIEGEEEGEGEGDGGGGGCDCAQGKNSNGQTASLADYPADITIVFLLLLAFGLGARKYARTA